MPYSILVEKTIPVSRAKVFAALTNFGGINKLVPTIESVTLQGSGVGALRTIILKGFKGTIVERLEVAFDGRLFSYSIVAESPLPFEHYHAVIELADAPNGGCLVKYACNCDAKGTSSPDEVKGFLTPLYNTIIDNIPKVA